MFICDACGKPISEIENRPAYIIEVKKETKCDLCKDCFGEWLDIRNEGLKMFIQTRKVIAEKKEK